MSSAFLSKIEKSKAFLFQGEINNAQNILIDLETESSVQDRWKDHYLGIVKMRQGDFDQAIAIFLNTLNKNGNNLSVILDLAGCYQKTGQILNWLKMVELAEYEYRNNQEKFLLSRKIQCLKLLAIFIEEKGQINESLEMYEQLLELVSKNDIQGNLSSEYVKLSAQIVRIYGEYSLKGNVNKYYELLSFHNAKNTNFDCDFEIQHALMIYELNFYGVESCLSRYRRVCSNPVSESFEINWINDNLFFGFLSRGHLAEANEISSKLSKEPGPFNTALQLILKTKRLDQEIYIDVITNITPAAQLRLLKVLLMNSNDLFALRKFSLLTNSFSKESKQIWSYYFSLNNLLEPNSTELFLNISEQVLDLNLNDRKLKLTKSYLEVFQIFIDKIEIPLPEILLALWNSTDNESDVARLRMRISRLNQILRSELGLSNVFQMDKHLIKTKYRISLSK